MITIKSKTDLAKMREAGKLAAETLKLAGESIKAGMSTLELNGIIHDFIISRGGVPATLGYEGFPASACISVNNEVIHGIPRATKRFKEGDIVSVDITVQLDGFHGDTCKTFACGKISKEAQELLDVTETALYKGIEAAQAGARLGDVSYAVGNYCTERGYGVVKDFCGHGIGKQFHEDPEIPNFGKRGEGPKLQPGMTLCIEPMINVKGSKVKIMGDGWTVRTVNGSLSAHFEHTVAITNEGPVILTAL